MVEDFVWWKFRGRKRSMGKYIVKFRAGHKLSRTPSAWSGALVSFPVRRLVSSARQGHFPSGTRGVRGPGVRVLSTRPLCNFYIRFRNVWASSCVRDRAGPEISSKTQYKKSPKNLRQTGPHPLSGRCLYGSRPFGSRLAHS